MMRLLPLLLPVLGLVAGLAAGFALAPEAEPDAESGRTAPVTGPQEETLEYVRLQNQFVVPVVREGRVRALVVVSISAAVRPGSKAAVFEAEPRLRDSFLQVLFDHANLGGFDGAFTAPEPMRDLRTALSEAGRRALPDVVRDVLITDIVRQDN